MNENSKYLLIFVITTIVLININIENKILVSLLISARISYYFYQKSINKQETDNQNILEKSVEYKCITDNKNILDIMKTLKGFKKYNKQ